MTQKTVINPKQAGSMQAVRQANSGLFPNAVLSNGNEIDPTINCVVPPPRFPHPATMAFAGRTFLL